MRTGSEEAIDSEKIKTSKKRDFALAIPFIGDYMKNWQASALTLNLPMYEKYQHT